ncbi:GTPase HflX [Coprothermobacteraceae bacterium]|nr:GTPase HflX [Coprothermobacteraceae bacterium]
MRAIIAYLVHGRFDSDFVEYDIEEIKNLARTVGFEPVQVVLQKREPDVRYFIGEGKVREIARLVQELGAEVVIFNEELSPRQVRELEKELTPAQVWDRTQVILEIFKRRATTRDGKLQVELARLNYLYPRIYGLGGVMSRLGGGVGTRGPGETKLEVLKRAIRRRIRKLEQEIRDSQVTRSTTGKLRSKGAYQVSVVGYTNAGKSTLINALAHAGKPTYADDQVFATLDTVYRRLVRIEGRDIVLVDTVGFVNFMPEKVMEAFKSTLQVIKDSDLILHVIDLSSPLMEEQMLFVEKMIDELGAGHRPILRVYNKLDLYSGALPKDGISISALKGINLERLREAIILNLLGRQGS